MYIFVEETVEKLNEPKIEQVLYFLDGNGENWLVEFLDSLTRNLTRKTMCSPVEFLGHVYEASYFAYCRLTISLIKMIFNESPAAFHPG